MRTKITIGTVVTALLIVAVIVFAVIMTNTNKDLANKIEDLKAVKVLTSEDFQQGGIDGTTGKLDPENEYALMTMNYHKLDGVEIDFENEDTTIQYKVFFYNQDKKFIGKTEYLKADFDISLYSSNSAMQTAVYFRLMVNTDEIKATADNASKLLEPLTITVQKK